VPVASTFEIPICVTLVTTVWSNLTVFACENAMAVPVSNAQVNACAGYSPPTLVLLNVVTLLNVIAID